MYLYFISNTVATVIATVTDMNVERQLSVGSHISAYLVNRVTGFCSKLSFQRCLYIEDGNSFSLQRAEGRFFLRLYKKDNVFWVKIRKGFLASSYKLIGFPKVWILCYDTSHCIYRILLSLCSLCPLRIWGTSVTDMNMKLRLPAGLWVIKSLFYDPGVSCLLPAFIQLEAC